jgi:hypothetical protein
MAEMPPAADIKDLDKVKESFFAVRLQGEDQAKAAFKNGYPFNSTRPIYWILVVGPYWMPIQLGPFSPANLTVRSHPPKMSWPELRFKNSGYNHHQMSQNSIVSIRECLTIAWKRF